MKRKAFSPVLKYLCCIVACSAVGNATFSDDRVSTPAKTLAPSNVDLNNGLIAYWAFEEVEGTNAIDSAGGFNGEIRNGTRITGHIGRAIEFNGVNTCVFVGAPTSALQLAVPQYTLSWWQKLNGTRSVYQNILAMDDGADYSGGYQVHIVPQTTRLQHVHSSELNPLWANITNVGSGWHHYAITFDGEFRHFYLDGVFVSSYATEGPVATDGDDPFVIGALALQNGTLVNFFYGALDEIRIYQRALNPEEIAALGPEPFISFAAQPKPYRLGSSDRVTISGAAYTVGTSSPISYQWESNRVAITDATNSSFEITASGGRISYRLLAQAGNLQVYSDEVFIETVSPSEARLLLHLEFEENTNQTFIDSAGNFENITGSATLEPGRVGNSAANIVGNSFIHVPAAATDLELVGTSYTIAWWMKPTPNGNGQIFSLGPPSQADTGYGSRTEGAPFQRSLRSEHRSSSQILTPLRSNTNWVHLAIVYNGVSRVVYTNGVAAGLPVATSTQIRGSGIHDLFFGLTNGLANVGLIDDFRIYNYPLASDELQPLVNVLPQPVQLTIVVSGENVLIRWPAANATQERLESRTSFEPESSWIPVSVPIGTTGFYREVSQPRSVGQRFYRLRQ
jgi:hypothetical protein